MLTNEKAKILQKLEMADLKKSAKKFWLFSLINQKGTYLTSDYTLYRTTCTDMNKYLNSDPSKQMQVLSRKF